MMALLMLLDLQAEGGDLHDVLERLVLVPPGAGHNRGSSHQ